MLYQVGLIKRLRTDRLQRRLPGRSPSDSGCVGSSGGQGAYEPRSAFISEYRQDSRHWGGQSQPLQHQL